MKLTTTQKQLGQAIFSRARFTIFESLSFAITAVVLASGHWIAWIPVAVLAVAISYMADHYFWQT